jgi:hypothetical protein
MDSNDNPSSERWFNWPADRDFIARYSEIRNEEDLYAAVSLFDSQVRSADTATVTHVVHADADTCPPEKFRLRPSIEVLTSEGHWHAWWIVDEEVTALAASEAAHRISNAHREDGCDRGWPRAKLLRVPGTSNTKYGEPQPVTAVYTGEVYTLDTINDVYRDVSLTTEIVVNDQVPDDLPKARMLELEDELETAGLSNLYLQRPQEGESWSERQYKLELELFRLGWDMQEVFCISRESSTNKYNPENAGGMTQSGVRIPKRQDPDGVLWREVQRAFAEYELTKDIEVERSATAVKVFTRPEFLMPDERKYVKENPCFIDEYTAWVAKRTDSAETYQRSLAFLLLSTIYGGRGYIPLRWSPHLELNLWMLLLGDTTSTRKSTAKSFYLRAVHTYESQTGEKLDIGSEATPEALVRVLGERDALVSVLHKDEVVGMFKEFLTKNYMSGAIETYTELYDGNVPVVLRASKDSGNKNRAKTIFNFVGVGIREGVAEVLTKSHFQSGYLARMLWAVADPQPRQAGSEDIAYADEQTAEERQQFDAEMAAIVAPFLKRQRQFTLANPVPMRMDRATQTRYNKWAEAGKTLAEKSGDNNVLVPSFERMRDSVLKASALLAMHEGEEEVTIRHFLHTLAQAELWFNDMVRMSVEVSSSEFERRCNDIEGFIASGKDKKHLESTVRKKFARYKPAEFDEIVRALQQQGRIRRDPNNRSNMEAL